jgi:D-alanyl-D-alanine carboxypeptidase-like protein
MSDNGKLPTGDLSPIPGGQLRKDAALAWLAMRSFIGRSKGIWICPTSPRTSYRQLADQQYFWNLYKSGKGALAAVPGTSNHGWGIAVDLPTPAMQAAVRESGHAYGWGIRGGRLSSDAPSEAWHCTFHPGAFKASPARESMHPYLVLSDRERAARDVLVKERRVAKSRGGWSSLDAIHRQRAVQAKADLRRFARDIASAARQSGWDRANRKIRYDYINKLTGG